MQNSPDCLALPDPQCLLGLLDDVAAMRKKLDDSHKSIMGKLNEWRSNHGEIEVWRRLFEREAETNSRIKAAVTTVTDEMQDDPSIDTKDWQTALKAAFAAT